MGVMTFLGQKLLNTLCSVGRCAYISPIMKWANELKESLKKFTEVECSLSQQLQLVHWNTGFLEHSPTGGRLYYKGPTLQNVILGFCGPPLYDRISQFSTHNLYVSICSLKYFTISILLLRLKKSYKSNSIWNLIKNNAIIHPSFPTLSIQDLN